MNENIKIIDVTNPPDGLPPIIGDSIFDGIRSIASIGIDNSLALAALRDYCEIDKTIPRTWYFPKGVYCYEDNKWFPNIDHFEIFSTDHAVLACTKSGLASGDITWAAGSGDIFRDTQRTSHSTYIPHMGYRINSVSAGQKFVTLSNPSEHSNFAIGNRVFLHGYNQQLHNAGYPPNSRYFEWNRITNINVITGEITLQRTTKNAYRKDWLYNNVSENGPVKLVNLDRPNYRYPEFIKLKGIRIASNPNADSATGLALIAHKVLVENIIHHGYLWPQQTQIMNIIGGYFEKTNDLDKLVEFLKISNIKSDSDLGAATNINNIYVHDSKFRGKCSLGAKNQRIIGNVFDLSDKKDGFGGWLQDRQTTPVHYLTARNNRIIYKGEMINHINNGLVNKTPVKSSSIGEFKVDIANTGGYSTLDLGTHIESSNGKVKATVTSLGFDGVDLYVKHSNDVIFTDFVYSSSFIKIDIDNSNQISYKIENDRTWKRYSNSSGLSKFSGTPNLYRKNRRIIPMPRWSTLQKVEFTLKKSSKSVDSNHAYMLLAKTSKSEKATQIFAGNSKTTHDKVIVDVQTGSGSWTSGWTSKVTNSFSGRINFMELWIASGVVPNGSMNDPTYTNENQLPEFEIIFYGDEG